MGWIQESQKKIIRRKLEAMPDKVSIVYFTQEVECAFCRETHEMLLEVAALSDKLELQVFDFRQQKAEAEKYGIDKIPAIVIRNRKDPGIRFYGVPAGYEFSTFLEDLVMVSRGDSGLSAPSRAALKALAAPVHLQVFVTPT
jgi:glutaredoxin-like protein